MALGEDTRRQAVPVFRFVVDIRDKNGKEPQAAFTECDLPVQEWETEEVKEGGVNDYSHQLPVRRRNARITLKNGVGKSGLLQWYINTMNGSFKRKDITVSLLDLEHKPMISWVLHDAFPIKWNGPNLRASDNTIAIQTLEFIGCAVSVEIHG